MKSNEKKNIIGLLGIHVTFFTLDVFISTFLVARLYQIKNSISTVCLFNLILLSTLFITYAIFSYVVKKFSRVFILRVAILINILLIVLIIINTNNLDSIYIYLGLINGISMGMYWASMHTLAGSVIKKEYIPTYMIYSQISFALAKIIFPLTLGALIDYISFETSAWFTVISGVFVILNTFLINDESEDIKKLSMKNFFKEIKDIKKPVIFNYIIQFMYGAYSNSINLSITILIIFVYKSNFSLGMYSSLFSFLSILLLTFYRFTKNKNLKNIIFVGFSLLIIILSSSLLFEINKLTLLLFTGSYLVLSAVGRSESDTLRLNIMKLLQKDKFIVESNLFIESSYFFARIFSLGLLLIISIINVSLFPLFIISMLLLQVTSCILINIWYKLYKKESD